MKVIEIMGGSHELGLTTVIVRVVLSVQEKSAIDDAIKNDGDIHMVKDGVFLEPFKPR